MLNPPLSLLSDDLLDYLVEHVARLPGVFANRVLHNLSLTDPVFTELCQKHIFRTLTLSRVAGSKSKMSKRLKKLKRILDANPLFANRIRKIELYIGHRHNAWLLQNPSGDSKDATLINVLRLLSSSPIPPYELHLNMDYPIEYPVLVVERLLQSFFSQTLTTLHLIACKNVPLPLFLICPKLKEVRLDRVKAEEDYGEYTDEHCSGREWPALDRFNYRDAHTVVEQMINPPSRFHTPVVLWSNLRILTLSPHEGKEMACLQSIINAACNTLEELYLTNMEVGLDDRLPLSELVNLSGLPRLRVFALCAYIRCNMPDSAVLCDIITVLSTIPASNSVTNLFFYFQIRGEHPFDGCLDEDWVGICKEVIRISSGKPLELDIQMAVHNGKAERGYGENELYADIMERTTSLSDHSEICTHFWNPTYWRHGVGPFPRGEVRSRCRR